MDHNQLHIWKVYCLINFDLCKHPGNSNPLWCSGLENPRDKGAWWAAIYGVAELDMTEVT